MELEILSFCFFVSAGPQNAKNVATELFSLRWNFGPQSLQGNTPIKYLTTQGGSWNLGAIFNI